MAGSAHTALGYALLAQSLASDALSSFAEALRLDPASAEALHGKGMALAALDRHSEAAASFRAALAKVPTNANTLYNLGNSLSALGQHTDALVAFDAAIRCKPAFATAYENRCRDLMALGRVEAALASMRQAVRLTPGSAATLQSLGRLLRIAGHLGEALETFETAVRTDPTGPYLRGDRIFASLCVCQWDGLSEETTRILQDLRSERRVLEPLVCASISQSAEDQLLCGKVRARDGAAPPNGGPPAPRYGHGRIRLAYLSADFREHPVGRVMAPIIEHHDRRAFEVTGLSFAPASGHDPLQARLESSCDRFVNAWGYSDAQVAQTMRELEIDIAVDLIGHSANARLLVFALRGAPIQVNYLGFPGTIGSSHWDYIIADGTVLPPEHECHYVERVVQLPDCYLACDRSVAADGRTPSRDEVGLPDNAFVFLAAHTSYKITPAYFDVWMRLLKNLDNSVLWLNIGDPTAMSHVRREAERRGVRGERLIFAKRTRSVEEHLARSRLADLALDTLPYNAHVTACDMLAAGLPILTCLGTTFAGRVCASVLKAAGLPELVTYSVREYETMALRLARTPALLANLRARLAIDSKAQPLFDLERFTRNLEQAYVGMWRRWEGGESAQSFAVDPSQL